MAGSSFMGERSKVLYLWYMSRFLRQKTWNDWYRKYALNRFRLLNLKVVSRSLKNFSYDAKMEISQFYRCLLFILPPRCKQSNRLSSVFKYSVEKHSSHKMFETAMKVLVSNSISLGFFYSFVWRNSRKVVE